MSPFRLPCLAVAAAVALTACPSADDRNPVAPASTQPAAETATRSSVIHGSAMYLERIAPPSGARLRVQLIDTLLADTPRAVLAEQTFDHLSGPPFSFTLPFDATKIRENGQYGLHASLSAGDGKLWFVTDTRVPVTPGSTAPVEFRMIRVTDPAAGGSEGTARTHWQCGDLRLDATYDNAADTATLTMSGRALLLPHARSASGARYADASGNEFWTKGDGGMVTLSGQAKLDCTRTGQASPWNEAAARGVGFRAVGSEPGWFVEVDQGEAPPLRATLDYGERKIEVASAQGLSGLLGWAGKTADGTQVQLLVERKSCADGMSGEAFEATAKLTVAGKVYQGCGAFLFD